MAFFKLDKNILEHTIWNCEPYSKGQAFVDLIGRANYKDEKRIFKGKIKVIKRGQLVTSEGKLAERWQWSRNKVRAFLRLLEELGMATAEGTAEGTTITIENYSKYQDVPTAEGTTKGTAQGTTVAPSLTVLEGTAQGTSSSIEKYSKTELHPTAEGTAESTAQGTAEGTHLKNIRNKEYININKGSSEPMRWGVCNNVYMTIEEVEDLKQRFPDDYDTKIDRLSTYMRSKGVEWKYQDHYATILMWANKDKDKAEKKEAEPKFKLGVDI